MPYEVVFMLGFLVGCPIWWMMGAWVHALCMKIRQREV